MLTDHRTEKRCGRCQQIKRIDCFGLVRNKRRCYCKDCRRKKPSSERVNIRDRKYKICPRCHKKKSIGQFRKRGQENNQDAKVWGYCRECNTTVCRERIRKRIATGEASIDYKVAYKIKRWKKILVKYGINQEQYEKLELAQEFLCAICGNPEMAEYKGVLCRLVVDHDHKTGN